MDAKGPPQRLQLTRRKGSNLEAASQALNGRPVVVISRPSKWGNPFSIAEMAERYGLDKAAAQARAIETYRRWFDGEQGLSDAVPPTREAVVAELGGKNLACWCAIGTPCHGDVLLAVANGEEGGKT